MFTTTSRWLIALKTLATRINEVIRKIFLSFVIGMQANAMQTNISTEIPVNIAALQTVRHKLEELNNYCENKLCIPERDFMAFNRKLKEILFPIDIDKAQRLTTCQAKLNLFLELNSKDINKFLRLGNGTFDSAIRSEQKQGKMINYGNYDSQKFLKIIMDWHKDMSKFSSGVPQSEEECSQIILDLKSYWENSSQGMYVINFLWNQFSILINFAMLQ